MAFTSMADVMRAAAARLEEVGWTQGIGKNETTGQECAGQALMETIRENRPSAGGPLTRHVTYLEALIALREFLHIDYVTIWNDTRGRTGPEVIDTLRKCAESYETEQEAAPETEAPDS